MNFKTVQDTKSKQTVFHCGHLVKVIWSFSISGTWLFAHYIYNVSSM